MPIDYESYTIQALKNSIRKNKKQLEEHEGKIANPSKFVADWNDRNEQYKNGIIVYWKKELVNLNEQIRLATEELYRRGKQ